MMNPFCWGLLLLLGVLACQGSESPANEAPLSSHKTVDSSTATALATTAQTPPPIDTSITLSYLMGQFDPAKDERFVEVKAPYGDRGGLFLRREVYQQLVAMADSARAAGVQLVVRSATRNFKRQKAIWEAKWTGARLVDGQDLSKTLPDPLARARKILEWSSMPGSSRHHWGTDLDLNAFENDYFESGRGLREYEWLLANAPRFGFCQTYSPKGPQRPVGYNEEKWHWSYLPLSQALTEQAELRLRNEDISGFKGAETAPDIDIVRNYVLGINPECKRD
ncbi:MAG: M15 family metallopeptidase [Bacteroidota bacterium]